MLSIANQGEASQSRMKNQEESRGNQIKGRLAQRRRCLAQQLGGGRGMPAQAVAPAWWDGARLAAGAGAGLVLVAAPGGRLGLLPAGGHGSTQGVAQVAAGLLLLPALATQGPQDRR